MEVFTSLDMKNTFAEILEYKFNPNRKLPLLAELSLKPRKKTPGGSVLAFVSEENSKRLYIENFDEKQKRCNLLPTLTLPFVGLIKSAALWQDFYFVYGNNGNIVCVNKKTLRMSLLPNMTTIRENGAMVVHDDFIYIIGGYKMNYRFSTNCVERWESYAPNSEVHKRPTAFHSLFLKVQHYQEFLGDLQTNVE